MSGSGVPDAVTWAVLLCAVAGTLFLIFSNGRRKGAASRVTMASAPHAAAPAAAPATPQLRDFRAAGESAGKFEWSNFSVWPRRLMNQNKKYQPDCPCCMARSVVARCVTHGPQFMLVKRRIAVCWANCRCHGRDGGQLLCRFRTHWQVLRTVQTTRHVIARPQSWRRSTARTGSRFTSPWMGLCST
jgi:hypothetical protein